MGMRSHLAPYQQPKQPSLCLSLGQADICNHQQFRAIDQYSTTDLAPRRDIWFLLRRCYGTSFLMILLALGKRVHKLLRLNICDIGALVHVTRTAYADIQSEGQSLITSAMLKSNPFGTLGMSLDGSTRPSVWRSIVHAFTLSTHVVHMPVGLLVT